MAKSKLDPLIASAAPSIYQTQDKQIGADTNTIISGIPGLKIRIFNYKFTASNGDVLLIDSEGNEYNLRCQSGCGSGLIELPVGADLQAVTSEDCYLSICVTATIS